jgi:hypothetical protein
MKRWEAWTNHLGWGVVAASGLVYGVLKYFVAASDPDSRLATPWQPSVLAVHLLAAPIAIFGLGLLFRRHALARWISGERQGRRTGGLLLWLAIPLGLSGYVVPVLTGELARRWTGWIHAAIGLLFTAGYALHPRTSTPPADSPEPPSEP